MLVWFVADVFVCVRGSQLSHLNYGWVQQPAPWRAVRDTGRQPDDQESRVLPA